SASMDWSRISVLLEMAIEFVFLFGRRLFFRKKHLHVIKFCVDRLVARSCSTLNGNRFRLHVCLMIVLYDKIKPYDQLLITWLCFYAVFENLYITQNCNPIRLHVR